MNSLSHWCQMFWPVSWYPGHLCVTSCSCSLGRENWQANIEQGNQFRNLTEKGGAINDRIKPRWCIHEACTPVNLPSNAVVWRNTRWGGVKMGSVNQAARSRAVLSTQQHAVGHAPPVDKTLFCIILSRWGHPQWLGNTWCNYGLA